MEDQGEKIVRLARAMLHTPNALNPAIYTAPERRHFPLKTLCLAALLSALGASVITHNADESLRPLNRYEKTELSALLFYTSMRNALPETALRDELREHFSVQNFDDLVVTDYKRVRDYLRERAL